MTLEDLRSEDSLSYKAFRQLRSWSERGGLSRRALRDLDLRFECVLSDGHRAWLPSMPFAGDRGRGGDGGDGGDDESDGGDEGDGGGGEHDEDDGDGYVGEGDSDGDEEEEEEDEYEEEEEEEEEEEAYGEGGSMRVTSGTFGSYVNASLNARLGEGRTIVNAIAAGVQDIVPLSVLRALYVNRFK